MITSTFDRLTLHPCEVFTFGNVNFKLLETATGDLDIFKLGDNNLHVKAKMTAVPELETYAILLLSLGLIGFINYSRKSL